MPTPEATRAEVRLSAYAIRTNGIGQKSDYHINRTVSLADVGFIGPDKAMERARARAAKRQAYDDEHGISKYDNRAGRIPYAGYMGW